MPTIEQYNDSVSQLKKTYSSIEQFLDSFHELKMTYLSIAERDNDIRKEKHIAIFKPFFIAIYTLSCYIIIVHKGCNGWFDYGLSCLNLWFICAWYLEFWRLNLVSEFIVKTREEITKEKEECDALLRRLKEKRKVQS